MEIILGSQSPRRRELLAGMGVPFTAVNIHADESFPLDLQGASIPLYISRAKAEAYRAQLKPGQLLITADTIVWVDGEQLGKPADEDDAVRMLRLLSGKTHQVFTGVTL
ncbi:MAG: Maf family protein, partial [Bacteroidales bacterium]|nr:Maf family protein [Bacteroidales bacterium]